jgi:hypothetical protein
MLGCKPGTEVEVEQIRPPSLQKYYSLRQQSDEWTMNELQQIQRLALYKRSICHIGNPAVEVIEKSNSDAYVTVEWSNFVTQSRLAAQRHQCSKNIAAAAAAAAAATVTVAATGQWDRDALTSAGAAIDC